MGLGRDEIRSRRLVLRGWAPGVRLRVEVVGMKKEWA